jgi:hypothetical protein
MTDKIPRNLSDRRAKLARLKISFKNNKYTPR